MALARKNLTIQDATGKILNGASIQFRSEETLLLPQCFSDRNGTIPIGNPYVAADGRNAGCFVVGDEYRITATLGDLVFEWRYEPVGLAAGTDFGGGDDSVQQVTGPTGVIAEQTTTAAVKRVAPVNTGLTLPDASKRNGRALRVNDYSTSVTNHTIALTPFQASQKINRQSTLEIRSNASNLAGVTLHPVIDPDDSGNYVWLIAP